MRFVVKRLFRAYFTIITCQDIRVHLHPEIKQPFKSIVNASVNSTCTQPPRPPPPSWADPRALAFYLPWMANSQWWRLLICQIWWNGDVKRGQIRWGGDEKRGQMPRPVLTVQHFSLIAQSNSAILNIIMSIFCFN